MTDREKYKQEFEEASQEVIKEKDEGVNPEDQGFVVNCSAGPVKVVYHLV